MATVSIEIPDEKLAKVVKALCAYGGLPESNANAKRVMVDWLHNTVTQQLHSEAAVDTLEGLK
jgi:hypothetical protein